MGIKKKIIVKKEKKAAPKKKMAKKKVINKKQKAIEDAKPDYDWAFIGLLLGVVLGASVAWYFEY